MSFLNYREPCSHINDKSVLFGLSYSDVSLMGAILAALLFINKHFVGMISFSYWSLMSIGLMAILLIPIRIQYRRKIIRDFLKHFFKSRLIYAPKHHRIGRNK